MKKWFYLLSFITSFGAFSKTNIKHLGLGTDLTCVASSEVVQCVGTRSYGLAQRIEGFSNIKQLSVGMSNVCVLDDAGIWCWGNMSGGLNDVPREYSRPELIANFIFNVCVIQDQTIGCWGSASMKIPPQKGAVKDLIAKYGVGCFEDEEGIECWGAGIDDLQIPKVTKLRNLAIGDNFYCGILDKKVECVGKNRYGVLEVPDFSDPRAIAAGIEHACALEGDDITCWGSAYGNQLNAPVGLKNISELVIGSFHSCVLHEDGVSCWGRNREGELKVPNNL